MTSYRCIDVTNAVPKANTILVRFLKPSQEKAIEIMSQKNDYCACGIPKLEGDNEDSRCSKCNLNVAPDRLIKLKRGSISQSSELNEVLLTTSPTIPGYEIVKILGLVMGVGNTAFKVETSAQRTVSAFSKALKEIQIEAKMLNADGVVSVQINASGSGEELIRTQTVTLLGTAVKLSKDGSS